MERGDYWAIMGLGLEEIPKLSLFQKTKFFVVNGVATPRVSSLIRSSCGAGILMCKPGVFPVERGYFAATMTRGLSRNIPSASFQNPSFLEKAAVFKCQDAPEMFTLKFGFWVAKCGWEY